MAHASNPGPLLIVDDRPDVRRGLGRSFGLHYTVFTADCGATAEPILIEHRPLFLLCDYWLGVDQPTGTELIKVWRGRFPFLRRVALMTGTRIDAIGDREGVDAIFAKPLETPDLVDWFLESGSTDPVNTEDR